MRTFLFFPSVTFFAMPMALLAMAVNLNHLQHLLGWRHDLAALVVTYGFGSLLILTAIYFQYFFSRGREALIREWKHPFQLSFFPLISISWFFTAYFAWRYLPEAWVGQWLYGVVLVWHGLLNLFLINRWLFDHQLTLDHMRPSWFILLSGDFVAVLVGKEINGYGEWMWLYYSVALSMWFIFATLLFYRLIFIKPIEEQYRPSLFIFLAPPSLASIAAQQLYGTVNNVLVWGPYAFATFMLAVWIISGRRFIRNGISMVSWSYIFPLAAFGLASQYLYERTGSGVFLWLSLIVMGGMVLLAGLITGWLIRVAIKNIRSKFA